MRRTRLFGALSIIGLVAFAVITDLWISQAKAQVLRIYHIDVGQADATLFIAPGGGTLLVDSGKNGDGDLIKAAMDAAGVTRIDHFVATHYHEDHYGGIDELLRNPISVSVVQAYDRGEKARLTPKKRTSTRYLEYHNSVGEDAVALMPGDTIPLDPLMTVTCIAANGFVVGETMGTPSSDENENSISLLIRFGGFAYIVGGDIHAPTERKIETRNLVMNVDVYQANHHGSNTSSDPSFLADMLPSVVIISNGSNALYQHPRQVTLDKFAALTPTPTVFQTNKYLDGDPLGGNVPDAFIADPETDDDDGTILVTVNLAAGSYTVSYGAVSRSFTIKGTSSAPRVVIHSLLPNPAGDDRQLEVVTLRNGGTSSESLAGWTLRDAAGLNWSLNSAGSIGPGATATIQRNGQAMSLNNPGDEITLLDNQGTVRDTFRYTSSSEGVTIATGH